MKKIYNNKILNIPNTNPSDNTFLFEYFTEPFKHPQDVAVIYMADLLEQRKNTDLLAKVAQKPAMYSNVYSPADELEIFTELFENALEQKKRIHIVGVTLWTEIQMLEEYYTSLGFMREDINCFAPNFSVPLVTVSVNIENLIWRGSDYKAQRKKIFFCPPIRESWENKAMFKWINRGVIAGIHIQNLWEREQNFLETCIKEEKVLSLTLAKVLKYNLEDVWCGGAVSELKIVY